jgi:hypothetical protein
VKTILTAALIAAAPAAVAAALITAPASPALACAAATAHASTETPAKFTSGILLSNTSRQITAGRAGFPEQLSARSGRAADLRGRRDGSIVTTALRSCI